MQVGREVGKLNATPAAYRTITVHEWHVIGPDGLPAHHRTIQVVRALRPGLAAYTYRFDRREAEVHALSGVRIGTVREDEQHPALTAVDLVFPRPLDTGETASFEYETVFRWRTVPPPRFRRAAGIPVEGMNIGIVFSPERLPAEVNWCVWDGFADDARLRAAERVELDGEHRAHRFIEKLHGHTVGFTWTWPPGLEPVAPGDAPDAAGAPGEA